MNLHKVVRGLVTAVNPDIIASFVKSTGNALSPSGKAVPKYAAAVSVKIQVQPMSSGDTALAQANMINMQGVMRTIFMYGDTQGIVRPSQQGGDLLKFSRIPNGPVSTWLVVGVLETWPTFCKVVACLQQ